MQSKKLLVRKDNPDFLKWIKSLEEKKLNFEIVIEKGLVNLVYVVEPDNGDWSNLLFGRVIYSAGTTVRQKIYKPVLIDGKFKPDEIQS